MVLSPLVRPSRMRSSEVARMDRLNARLWRQAVENEELTAKFPVRRILGGIQSSKLIQTTNLAQKVRGKGVYPLSTAQTEAFAAGTVTNPSAPTSAPRP